MERFAEIVLSIESLYHDIFMTQKWSWRILLKAQKYHFTSVGAVKLNFVFQVFVQLDK